MKALRQSVDGAAVTLDGGKAEEVEQPEKPELEPLRRFWRQHQLVEDCGIEAVF
jgi:hypothetical protein